MTGHDNRRSNAANRTAMRSAFSQAAFAIQALRVFQKSAPAAVARGTPE
jgi:hypothetical protein